MARSNLDSGVQPICSKAEAQARTAFPSESIDVTQDDRRRMVETAQLEVTGAIMVILKTIRIVRNNPHATIPAMMAH